MKNFDELGREKLDKQNFDELDQAYLQTPAGGNFRW